jgi:hypothetical protein
MRRKRISPAPSATTLVQLKVPIPRIALGACPIAAVQLPKRTVVYRAGCSSGGSLARGWRAQSSSVAAGTLERYRAAWASGFASCPLDRGKHSHRHLTV